MCMLCWNNFQPCLNKGLNTPMWQALDQSERPNSPRYFWIFLWLKQIQKVCPNEARSIYNRQLVSYTLYFPFNTQQIKETVQFEYSWVCRILLGISTNPIAASVFWRICHRPRPNRKTSPRLKSMWDTRGRYFMQCRYWRSQPWK